MNYAEREKILRLRKIFDKNYEITRLYTAYLERCPTLITKEAVEALTEEGLTPLDAVRALVCEILGLNYEKAHDRELIRDYITPSVRLLDSKRYTEDSYFKSIKIENKKIGDWELRREFYPPYRAVICDDLTILPDGTEIPQLGFFPDGFEFPAVLEGGNEWMTLTPVDMDTCTEAIAAARGRVVTFGLGLGYYAYRAAEKPEVSQVTVVERSEEVIKLFKSEILPQIPFSDKISIVNADAFEYARNIMPKENFDLAFVDIWRDGGDGSEAYKKMKPLESLSPSTEFLYWIEGFIKSRIRAEKFEALFERFEQGETVELSNFSKIFE